MTEGVIFPKLWTVDSKKIFHEGIKIKDNINLNAPLLANNNTLYSMTSDSIMCFDKEENTFVKLISFNGYGVGNLCVINDHMFLYIMSDYPSTAGKIVLHDNKTKSCKTLIDKDVTCFSFVGNKIYYVAIDKDVNRIFRYDRQTLEDKLLCELSNATMYYLLFSNNNLVYYYYSDDDSIFYIDRINLDENMEETENLYSSSNGDISFNCHNGYVYVCDHGLKKISLTNKEERKISSKDCSSCYIVDDKWVYFVDYNSALWRVTQDGTDLKKMYG